MAGSVIREQTFWAPNDRREGFRQMMGTIVLSMLLGWFGLVAALTIWSGGNDETAAEKPTRITGAPQLASDESHTSIGA